MERGEVRTLAKGTGITFVGGVAGNGLNYVAGVVLARFLGAELIGVYFLSLAWLNLASIVGRLGLADALVVTGDSVTMISEAAATGKPVHVVELPGGTAKFSRFHAGMGAAGITRPFDGRLESWDYPPLEETARAAAEIRRRLA